MRWCAAARAARNLRSRGRGTLFHACRRAGCGPVAISATVLSAGRAIRSGRSPARPSRIVRSVAWPLPVRASDTFGATGPPVRSEHLVATQLSTKRQAAVHRSIVCELDDRQRSGRGEKTTEDQRLSDAAPGRRRPHGSVSEPFVLLDDARPAAACSIEPDEIVETRDFGDVRLCLERLRGRHLPRLPAYGRHASRTGLRRSQGRQTMRRPCSGSACWPRREVDAKRGAGPAGAGGRGAERSSRAG